MSDEQQDHPYEPPIAGDETSTLLGSLERQRATFAWKCGGLDAAGMQATVGASSMTLTVLASVGSSPVLLTVMRYSIRAPGIALGLVEPFTGSEITELSLVTLSVVCGRQNWMSWMAIPCWPGLAGAVVWLP